MAAKPIMAERMIGLDSVPDVNDPKPLRTLGIFISCHGQLEPGPLIPPPLDVRIQKQNLGGLGCKSYRMRSEETFERTALNLLNPDFIGCTQEEYQSFKSYDERDTYGDLIDKDESCEIFLDASGWIKKKYTFDKTKKFILIAFEGKVINIATCTLEEFNTFLNRPSSDRLIPIFRKRDRQGYISTNDIFTIIDIFKSRHRIQFVNILDESCNVVLNKVVTEKEHRTPKGTTTVRGYFGIPKTEAIAYVGRNPYGGKRRKTKRVRRFYFSNKKW